MRLRKQLGFLLVFVLAGIATYCWSTYKWFWQKRESYAYVPASRVIYHIVERRTLENMRIDERAPSLFSARRWAGWETERADWVGPLDEIPQMSLRDWREMSTKQDVDSLIAHITHGPEILQLESYAFVNDTGKGPAADALPSALAFLRPYAGGDPPMLMRCKLVVVSCPQRTFTSDSLRVTVIDDAIFISGAAAHALDDSLTFSKSLAPLPEDTARTQQ